MRLPLSQTFLSTITPLIRFFTSRNLNIHTNFVGVEGPHRDIFDKQQDTDFPAAKQRADRLETYTTTNINITYPTDRRVYDFEALFAKLRKATISFVMSVCPSDLTRDAQRKLALFQLQGCSRCPNLGH